MKPRIDRKTIGVLLLCGALILLAALFFARRGAEDIRPGEHRFFMENGRGTYNLVELVVPEDKGPYPVVLMAHGFAGTLHSGGARELAGLLADKGILAVMIDFDPYMEPDTGAEQTHIYPISQMKDDAVLLLKKITQQYGGDSDNISLYGRSYGGRLMMTMANESTGGYEYRKLALVAPAGDDICFIRYMGGEKRYEAMKKEAAGEKGYSEKLGIKVTPRWFEDVESYDPSSNGGKFGDRPVLLFYNTKDDVVYPDTAIRCAEAYENHEIVKVTTEDGHGYEMGYPKSELKDEIMEKLVDFLAQ